MVFHCKCAIPVTILLIETKTSAATNLKIELPEKERHDFLFLKIWIENVRENLVKNVIHTDTFTPQDFSCPESWYYYNEIVITWLGVVLHFKGDFEGLKWKGTSKQLYNEKQQTVNTID